MIGNKYSGDALAEEFYKVMLLKKRAADEAAVPAPLANIPENHVEDEVINPEDFLQKLEPTSDFAEREMDQKIQGLDSWAKDNIIEDSFAQPELYPEEDYLLDRRATEVLTGLGKIAGSLRLRGEGFASDMVEATALSIRNDLVKEAQKKLKTVNLLTKIASEIEKSGDKFTADMVTATICKIKNK